MRPIILGQLQENGLATKLVPHVAHARKPNILDWIRTQACQETLTMRRPAVQFTVRGMMILVGILSLFLALIAYRQRLQVMAASHESEAFRLFNPISVIGTGPPGTIHRRTPGQTGTLAYQPTPQGLEQMKAGGEYAHAAARIDTILGTLLFVLVMLGMSRLIAIRYRRQRSGFRGHHA